MKELESDPVTAAGVAHLRRVAKIIMIPVGIAFVLMVIDQVFANIEARARSGYFRARQGFETLGEAIERYRADHGSQLPPRLGALTTPVAYLTAIPTDPFGSSSGLPPGYLSSGDSYVLRSFGPDADEATGGDLPWSDAEAMNALLADQTRLLPYTYDPSNGTFSEGDIWRVGGAAAEKP